MKKSVFITGGSRGIGAACVRKFSASGYMTAFTYRSDSNAANRLAEETGALALKADSSVRDEVFDAVKQARTYFGLAAFDVLISNAGIAISCLITDMDESSVDELIGVNLKGAIFASQAVLPSMISEKCGSIILISSIWGKRAASCESVYAASKAGIIGFARSLAAEVGPSGIRVNVIGPGVIDTDMNSCYSSEEMDALKADTPLQRIGSPDDVADAAFFLAGEQSSFITGQVIGVDGGFAV